MTEARLEEALRAAGRGLMARPLPAATRRRAVEAALTRRPVLQAASVVLPLVALNVAVGCLVLELGGALRHGTAPGPTAAAAAAAAPTGPRDGIRSALITGRGGVDDAWMVVISSCHTATDATLPVDPQGCRQAALAVAASATGFAADLRAVAVPAGSRAGVSDLLITLARLHDHAVALAADLDRGDAAAVLVDEGHVDVDAAEVHVALVYG